MNELHRLVRLREQGLLGLHEFAEKIAAFLARFPQCEDDATILLCDHPSEAVQAAVSTLWDLLRQRKEFEQAKNIQHLRRASPLQPGTRLELYGGYTAAYESPHWLNGRESVQATFRQFVQGKPDKMPAAFIEFDEAMPAAEHTARYALLKLLYVGTWGASETVVVHLVEALPKDIDAFYAADPYPYPKAIETHASYQIVAAR